MSNGRFPRTVGEVMTTRVVSLDENDTLLDLQQVLDSFEFRHVPVTQADRLIGLLSERDVLRLSSSSLLPHGQASTKKLQERFRVSDVMIVDVITVAPEVTLKEAGQLMRQAKIDCLPVVDEDGALVGILTASDFVQVVIDHGED